MRNVCFTIFKHACGWHRITTKILIKTPVGILHSNAEVENEMISDYIIVCSKLVKYNYCVSCFVQYSLIGNLPLLIAVTNSPYTRPPPDAVIPLLSRVAPFPSWEIVPRSIECQTGVISVL